jgi:hypothetical protein
MMRFHSGTPDTGNGQDAKQGAKLDPSLDARLDQALKDFKLSVHAWSEAEYGKPRTAKVVRLTSWRTAASWALGCVLAAGSIGGGLYDRHHQQEQMKAAAAAAARQQKLADVEQARKDDEDLLAKVDNDLSRQVPRAMEPLAQLMAEDGAQ